jgi:hypothetical protein
VEQEGKPAPDSTTPRKLQACAAWTAHAVPAPIMEMRAFGQTHRNRAAQAPPVWRIL